MSPEEMLCEAVAPVIESKSEPFRGSEAQSDRMLVDLARFVERVAEHGVSSPLEEAMLQGAKHVFESMVRICEQASDKSSAAHSARAMREMAPMSAMSIASFDPESLLESAGPRGIEKSPKKKAAKRKPGRAKRKPATS